ncbi:MAG TPA: hypothetical protein VMT98_05185 [Verrucomicrobiae bacterium]|nr:hypothetical protein [Verrucomicrobiae bacterium]
MSAVTLESAALRVRVNPEVGGTITEIEHKRSGLSVLGRVPWEPVDAAIDPPAAPDERTWLTRYTGGWPLLFPNGGDACDFAGKFHGFHGEASIAPWQAEAGASTLRLTRRFLTVPVRMQREIALDRDVVVIRETAIAEGSQPVTVMWGHHPTFGSDLLDGDFEIQAGARTVMVDRSYDPPANPLHPGASGNWPMVQGKAGMVDLRREPRGTVAALAYLGNFESPWISIRRLDNAIAATLSWDERAFPSVWLWYELGGTTDVPWCGKARLIGLEPNTTGLGAGLAEADQRGERLLVLQPGVAVDAVVRLHVSQPVGAITGVNADGRALSDA